MENQMGNLGDNPQERYGNPYRSFSFACCSPLNKYYFTYEVINNKVIMENLVCLANAARQTLSSSLIWAAF